MLNHLRWLGVLFSVAFAPAVLADSELIGRLEALREAKPNAGMAIGVIRRDEGLVKFIGLGDVDHSDEREEAPSADSLFMIGSTTKAFTATAAGALVGDGILEWDQRVRSVLPGFRLKDESVAEQVTLRDLLLHRTGLPRHDLAWYTRDWSEERYFHQLLPLLDFSEPFRGKWQYQNLMYMVAGRMVGRAAGSSWSDVVRRRILSPLGMTSTYFTTTEVEDRPNLARPHQPSGEGFTPIPMNNIDGVAPAGSMHSSVRDLALWVKMNLVRGDGVIPREVMNEIHRDQIDVTETEQEEFSSIRYALGWMRYRYRGFDVVAHSGGIDGYLTQIAFLPGEGVGIVVLTNGGTLNPEYPALTVMDRVLGLDPVDWAARAAERGQKPPVPTDRESASQLTRADGVYTHPVYGELTAEAHGEGEVSFILLKLNGLTVLGVSAWKTDDPRVWEFEYDTHFVRFHLSEDLSRVERIEANLEPKLPPLEFTRQN